MNIPVRIMTMAATLFAAFVVALPEDAAAQNLPGGSWSQSCRNAQLRGDQLYAQCRGRDGNWHNTRIDIDRCGRGGTLANNNGELVCERMGQGAGNLPPGSWNQSCRNARMEGRDGDTLRAECRTRDGRWIQTRLDTDRCGRSRAVANNNGQLVCESQVGQGAPWWGQGLPQGSYRQSCRNARLEGRDLLIAECRRQNGNWRNTRLDIDECRGRDIANVNGHLECGTRRFGGNYGYQMPGGTWQQSCRNARIVRDELTAECRKRDGDWQRDTIDLDECRGQPLHNDNGRLRCGSGVGSRPPGGGQLMPAGSWQQSCRNPRFEGGRFHADCRRNNGSWNTDGIDLRDCQGRPLSNQDGKLRC